MSGSLLERIKERRILKDADKGTSYLAIKAAQDLIAKANIDPLEIDLMIMHTLHHYQWHLQDRLMLQLKLGLQCFWV
jgi:3-oxoacyl-[acyl-carrier-protein] synthase III